MFKKYTQYILVFFISIILTGFLTLFLNQIEQPDSAKTKFQTNLESVSHRWNDRFYQLQSNQSPNSDVLVLAIDEASIIEIGRWPWSRNIINQMTDQLLKYNVKTIAFDIIFSEKENSDADGNFVKTIAKSSEKLTFGTFSDNKIQTLPYQDYCLTQAFLYTGGESLAKINPYFSVDDEANKYEEIEFNKIFYPLFKEIEQASENKFLKESGALNKTQLSQYQLNTLIYTNHTRVYEYCKKWLTKTDDYKYQENPNLEKIYLQVFKTQNTDSLKSILTDLKTNTKQNSIIQYAMWRQNINEIQQAAQYTASFVAHPDADGIIRSYPLVLRTGNQLGTSYIPSLALQTYLAATGYQALFKIDSIHKNKIISKVEIKDTASENEKIISDLPINYEGRLMVNYYGKQNTIKYISAKELLNKSDTLQYYTRSLAQDDASYIIRTDTVPKSEFLKNKNIIFGATAIGIYDIRTTPNDINYPGPEIHATVLSNLFNNQFLRYANTEAKNAPYIFFAFITILLLLFIKLGLRGALISFASSLTLLIYLQNYLHAKGVLFQSSLLFVILTCFAFFTIFSYKYFFQSRKSKEIKMAFSKYVSKDVVEEILKNEGAIELRGQKLHMSVYFSDIRGFTSFSEKMDPVELSEMLNKYFTPMSAIITKNRGTIDKYIGDAIMAMFGAPINYPDHAFKACFAAIECIAILDQINAEFTLKNWPRIDIGIGINTGYMNAGNIGSETIQNYTVIGDSVNLGSRLESLTKEYNVKIIISEFTYEIVKDSFICRELDIVQVKGKKEPVKIYELISVK